MLMPAKMFRGAAGRSNISFVGSSSANCINGAAMTLTLPGGIVQNDMVFVLVTSSIIGGVLLQSSGWTFHSTASVGDAAAANTFTSYYKLMGSTPDTVLNWNAAGTTSDTQCAIALVFRGQNLASPWDLVPGATVQVNTKTIPQAPALGVTNPNCCLIIAAQADQVSTVGNVPGYAPTIARNASDTKPTTLAATYQILQGGGGMLHTPPAWDAWSPVNTNSAMTLALRSS